MRKNLALVFGLTAVVLLAGCGQDSSNGDQVQVSEQNEVVAGTNEQENTESEKTSLTVADLEYIEKTLPPVSYSYETYDMQAQTITNSDKYEVSEGEEPKFFIPEYETMVSREVTSSSIEDDMIYTLVKLTQQDGTVLDVLYVNEPDTLLCRAISIQNGDLTTLYSNFVYGDDLN